MAAAAHTEYDTGLALSAVCELEPYWEALRKVYAPFESGLLGRAVTLDEVLSGEANAYQREIDAALKLLPIAV